MGQGPAKVHVALLPGIAFACCRVKPLNRDAGFLATSTNQAISQVTEVQRSSSPAVARFITFQKISALGKESPDVTVVNFARPADRGPDVATSGPACRAVQQSRGKS